VEAVTWSFIGKAEAVLFGGGSPLLALANPIAADLSDMRPSLLPGLMKGGAAQRRPRVWRRRPVRGRPVLSLGRARGVRRSAPAAVRRGTARAEGVGRHWNGGAEGVDAFDAKADALALLAALGVPTGGLQVVPGGPAWFHPGRSGTLQFGPKGVVGAFGEVHPRVLKDLDVKGPLVAFEITLDALPVPKAKPTKIKPKLVLPEFQPLTRDFAFVVGRDVKAGDILRAAQGAERNLVTGVEVFDVYEGPGIEPGRKSVAVAVTLQPTRRPSPRPRSRRCRSGSSARSRRRPGRCCARKARPLPAGEGARKRRTAPPIGGAVLFRLDAPSRPIAGCDGVSRKAGRGFRLDATRIGYSPAHCRMRWCAIAIGAAAMSSSGCLRSIIRRHSSLENQRASSSSSRSMVMSRLSASPTQPIMSEDGKGQGCDIE
jgi:hypothetical protein